MPSNSCHQVRTCEWHMWGWPKGRPSTLGMLKKPFGNVVEDKNWSRIEITGSDTIESISYSYVENYLRKILYEPNKK